MYCTSLPTDSEKEINLLFFSLSLRSQSPVAKFIPSAINLHSEERSSTDRLGPCRFTRSTLNILSSPTPSPHLRSFPPCSTLHSLVLFSTLFLLFGFSFVVFYPALSAQEPPCSSPSPEAAATQASSLRDKRFAAVRACASSSSPSLESCRFRPRGG